MRALYGKWVDGLHCPELIVHDPYPTCLRRGSDLFPALDRLQDDEVHAALDGTPLERVTALGELDK